MKKRKDVARLEKWLKDILGGSWKFEIPPEPKKINRRKNGK